MIALAEDDHLGDRFGQQAAVPPGISQAHDKREDAQAILIQHPPAERPFPELARHWLARSLQRFAPVIADMLRELPERGELDVADPAFEPRLKGHEVTWHLVETHCAQAVLAGQA